MNVGDVKVTLVTDPQYPLVRHDTPQDRSPGRLVCSNQSLISFPFSELPAHLQYWDYRYTSLFSLSLILSRLRIASRDSFLG